MLRIIWIGCFCLTALVVVLQLIPITGIFLMLFAAIAWPVVTINLGFLFLALDALFGNAPRWLVTVPVLWFGGYLVAAGMSQAQVWQLSNEISAQNSGKSIHFDPKTDSLLIESGSDQTVSAARLVENYDIALVHKRTSGSGQCSRFRSVSLRSWGCARGSGIVGKTSNGCAIITNRIARRTKYPRKTWSLKNVCRVNKPSKPAGSIVTVEVTGSTVPDSSLLKGKIQTVEIGDSQDTVTVTTAHVRPLAWFPMPMIGCGLDSGRAEWVCGAQFVRRGTIVIGAEESAAAAGGTGVVANVLGLHPVTVEERFPQPVQ